MEMNEREKISRWMEQWQMWPQPGELILCAVSGGKDSMSLLSCLQQLGREKSVRVAAAHFHHGIRGAAADRDAQFVRDWCQQQGIPCFVGYGNAPAAAAEQGWSLEEAARRLRYAFLEETACRCGAARIATAHQQEDNAETLLFHLLRGTGLRGLGGIAPVRGKLIRPMLNVSRQEVETYVAEQHIPFVEDESNTDESYSRNFLRHSVLPLLRRNNPRATEHMAATALLLRQEEALLQDLAEQWLSTLSLENGQAFLPIGTWEAAPAALHIRMLRGILERMEIPLKDISQCHWESICQLPVEGCADLPHGLMVWRQREGFLFCRWAAAQEATPLSWENWTVWGGYAVLLTKKVEKTDRKAFTMTFSCDKITESFVLRSWTGADRLTLGGSRGSRSVKRLLTERGLSRQERECLPALCSGDRLIGVCGLGTDLAFAPEEGSVTGMAIFRKKKGEQEQ